MLEMELYARWMLRQRYNDKHFVRARMLREAQLLRAAERQARHQPSVSRPRAHAPATRAMSCC